MVAVETHVKVTWLPSTHYWNMRVNGQQQRQENLFSYVMIVLSSYFFLQTYSRWRATMMNNETITLHSLFSCSNLIFNLNKTLTYLLPQLADNENITKSTENFTTKLATLADNENINLICFSKKYKGNGWEAYVRAVGFCFFFCFLFYFFLIRLFLELAYRLIILIEGSTSPLWWFKFSECLVIVGSQQLMYFFKIWCVNCL